MDPAELTTALNAAIIAIIAGILTAGLGAAGSVPVTSGAEGVPAAPPVPAPDPGPLSSGLLDPVSGAPVPAWEAGKYGPDDHGKEGQPGDVWYDGVWQPAAMAAARIQSINEQIQSTRDREAAQAAFDRQQLGASRQRNSQLDQQTQAKQQAADATARAERDARTDALRVAREQARIEVRKDIEASNASNAADAQRWRESADRNDTAAWVGQGVRKGADFGVSILSNYTGPAGKFVDAGYTFATTIADKVGDGQSYRAAVKEGAAAVGLGYVSGKIQSATGLEFKTPNLANSPVAVKTFFKTVTKDGVSKLVPRTWTGNETMNWVIGQKVSAGVGKAAEAMGLKEPDD